MPQSPRIAVVIPALDEAASLPGVLADLPPVHRVVVVDNGSTDGTPQVARDAGAEVVEEPRRGYGSAVQRGIRALHDDPPEVLVILDADHADRPDLLHRLVGPILADEADLVLSERSATAEPGALTPAQRYGNWLATRLMARACGHAYRDLGPFRAIRWTSLQALGMEDPTWGWNVEMGLKAAKHGLRILEVPMPYRRRHSGRSKISGTIRGTVRAGARILWAVARYR
jgi:glycosyltransferase involved in cell wall biosynthesis